MSDRDTQQAKVRASMLTHARLLGNRSADGWTSGSKIALAVGLGDNVPHAAQLLGDLVEWGLLAEKAQQPGAESAELAYRRFKITDKAWRLWSGEIDPIPGVADRRAE